MKVVIAIDSFKGSLSSLEAGYAAGEGVHRAVKADVVVKPLADGGEGTTEALIEGLGGSFVEVNVTGPLGTNTTARYGIMKDGVTAVIEMAEAAGITLVKREELDPLRATTYGVGQIIADAIKRGCRNFLVGIGGSATTDGGVGMLQALGYEFLNRDGTQVGFGIGKLDTIEEIRAENRLEELKDCRFQVACDVKNPLCKDMGAVYVFGPQKGVRDEEKADLDRKMQHYAERTRLFTGKDNSMAQGAGAAGGLGFAFLSYLDHVELKSGIDIVIQAIELEKEIADADIVITGEGRLDGQTAMGKVPVGVAHLAKKYGKTVVAFAGGVTEDARKCNAEGIDAFFPIVQGVTTLEEAMHKETAKHNLANTAEQVFRLIDSAAGI